MTDRRQHTRKQRTLDFYCYIDGVRFDSPSLDISEGGAFLATRDPIPIGATVVVVPKALQEQRRAAPSSTSGAHRVLLVGRVVRRQGAPRVGVGIGWAKCVSRAGLDALFTFLSTVLEIFPSALPLPEPDMATASTIAWDFERRRFQVMEIAAREQKPPSRRTLPKTRAEEAPSARPAAPAAPAAQAAPTPIPEAPAIPPVAMTKSSEAGALTTIIRSQDARVPVNVTVEYFMGDTIYHGTVIAIAASVLTLRLPKDPPPGTDRFVLSFPLSYKGATHLIYLACKLGGTARAADGAPLLDLSIREVDNEPAPGIFLRYVKYLYFHRVVDDE